MLTLAVNQSDLDWNFFTIGLNEIVGRLMASGYFKVERHTEKIQVDRNFRATILMVEGRRIYVDFWEYGLPTYSEPVYDASFDLIIKLQHRVMPPGYFEHQCARSKFLQAHTMAERCAFLDKIIPWTFFPSKMFNGIVGHENELEPLPVERIGFFCGKFWKARHRMLDHLKKSGIECIQSDRLEFKEPITQDDYLRRMRTSRLGIILGGRASAWTECKNRREIDYMILKKPLVMNYKPLYYEPLIEGKHYIFFDEKTDVNRLPEMYNIEAMVQEAYAWYLRNASPQGVVESFMKILKERLNIQ